MTPAAIIGRGRPSLWRIGAVAAIVPLALAVFALWFSSEMRRAEESNDLVNRTYARQLMVAELLSTMQDGETGQRGYVITGNRDFLRPYYDAEKLVGRRVDDLQRLMADEGAGTRKILAGIRVLVDRKFDEMRKVIALRDAQGLAAAQVAVGNGEGKQIMDAIRARTAQLADAEQQMLERHLQGQRDHTSFAMQAIWIIVAIGCLLAYFGAWLLWSNRIQRYETAVKAADAMGRTRAIFDNSLDAIVLLNPSGSIEELNPSAERLFGYPATDIMRRDITLIAELAPGEGPFLKRLGVGPDGIERPFRDHVTARRADGSYVPVEVALGMIDLPDGQHVVAAFRDISEREKAEEMKDQFLSTVSHELRTPLTSIVGSLGLLRGGGMEELSPNAQRLIVIAENNAGRLIRLVNDLLDMEKLDAGAMPFDFQPIAVDDVLSRSVDAVRGVAAERNVTIEVATGADPFLVRADHDRLIQILVNLLSNAIRFSPEGGAVQLSMRSHFDAVTVSVRDNGAGVPPEFARHLFGRFAQSSQRENASKGTGLGLAICRQIVRAHGGEIWHEAPDDGGARFSFDLPLWNSGSRMPVEDDGLPRLLVCAGRGEADAIVRAFADRQVRADVVADLAAVRTAARQDNYVALVIDCQCAEEGGADILRALRTDPSTRSLPVIAVAGEGRAPGDWASIDIVDWIAKPIDTNQLGRAVDSVVQRAQESLPLILHVDDDSDTLEITARALSSRARVAFATDMASARAFLSASRPDAVVVDLGLPDGSGHDLISELAERDGRSTPVIIYSAQEDGRAFAREVQAVLTKSRRSLPSLVDTVGAILEKLKISQEGADERKA